MNMLVNRDRNVGLQLVLFVFATTITLAVPTRVVSDGRADFVTKSAVMVLGAVLKIENVRRVFQWSG